VAVASLTNTTCNDATEVVCTQLANFWNVVGSAASAATNTTGVSGVLSTATTNTNNIL